MCKWRQDIIKIIKGWSLIILHNGPGELRIVHLDVENKPYDEHCEAIIDELTNGHAGDCEWMVIKDCPVIFEVLSKQYLWGILGGDDETIRE